MPSIPVPGSEPKVTQFESRERIGGGGWVGNWGEGYEGEWTGKVEIRTRKKFLAVGEARKAIIF